MHFSSLDRMAKYVRVPNQKKIVLLFHFLQKISHNLCFCEQKKNWDEKKEARKKEKLENEKISFVTSNSCVLLLDSIQKNNFSFTIHIFFCCVDVVWGSIVLTISYILISSLSAIVIAIWHTNVLLFFISHS